MGSHLCEVIEILGRSQISLKKNTYGVVMKASLRRGADKMDSFLRAGGVREGTDAVTLP